MHLRTVLRSTPSEHLPCDRDLGHLEDNIAAVAHTFAPILISFSFRLVSDQSLIGSGESNRQKECVQMPGENARENGQIRPRTSVRVTRGAGSGQHLASVLQEGRENAKIDAGLGFIWRISDNSRSSR